MQTQSELWKVNTSNWRIQEESSRPVFEAIIRSLNFKNNGSLIDIGCGTGFFLSLVPPHVAITGIDISESQLEMARATLPEGVFKVSGMDDTPFADASFDHVVTTNSLQFSPSPIDSLKEMRRILRADGRLVVCLWGEPRYCDSYAYFREFYLLSGQPLEISIPFNLSGAGVLKQLLNEAGLRVAEDHYVDFDRAYPDLDTAVKGILSSGPANQAINASSAEVVTQKVTENLAPFRQEDGSYRLRNRFTYIIATKA